MKKLILVRHGESLWNLDNRFTGWIDVDLSENGRREAVQAGILMKDAGLKPQIAYTSRLKRAVRTLWLALDAMDLLWLDVKKTWRLNERHYGALQGLNKLETAEKHGEDQVKIWRRSYSTPPPLLDKSDSSYPGNDRRYDDIEAKEIPSGESLEMTVARLMPYWESEISTAFKSKDEVLVVAHGNSLRALVKYLDKMSEEQILELNIPTGIPMVYNLDQNLNVINKKYLGDAAELQKAQDAVANQGKKKL